VRAAYERAEHSVERTEDEHEGHEIPHAGFVPKSDQDQIDEGTYSQQTHYVAHGTLTAEDNSNKEHDKEEGTHSSWQMESGSLRYREQHCECGESKDETS